MNHAVHHLAHAEAVAEVVKGVVAIVLLNRQLWDTDAALGDGRAPPTPTPVHRCRSGVTSQRFSVMGFMLNSFTRPKSWYMYSRQLSICSHRGRKG